MKVGVNEHVLDEHGLYTGRIFSSVGVRGIYGIMYANPIGRAYVYRPGEAERRGDDRVHGEESEPRRVPPRGPDFDWTDTRGVFVLRKPVRCLL